MMMMVLARWLARCRPIGISLTPVSHPWLECRLNAGSHGGAVGWGGLWCEDIVLSR